MAVNTVSSIDDVPEEAVFFKWSSPMTSIIASTSTRSWEYRHIGEGGWMWRCSETRLEYLERSGTPRLSRQDVEEMTGMCPVQLRVRAGL